MSSPIDDGRELDVRQSVLTAEEIAVLTGRDDADSRADWESDLFHGANDCDRTQVVDDPGGIADGLGFDVIEVGGGDDKLVAGKTRMIAETVVAESKPDATASGNETDLGVSSGIDVIKMSANEDEKWVFVGHE
jgi:hypothetical protein